MIRNAIIAAGSKDLDFDVRMDMDSGVTRFTGGSMSAVSLPMDPHTLAADYLGPSTPTPIEIELAIEAVEASLMKAGTSHSHRGVITTSNPEVRSLPGLTRVGGKLTRDEIEELFGRIAIAASGRPSALGGIPSDPKVMAALIILREAMHHLGFTQIQAVSD